MIFGAKLTRRGGGGASGPGPAATRLARVHHTTTVVYYGVASYICTVRTSSTCKHERTERAKRNECRENVSHDQNSTRSGR